MSNHGDRSEDQEPQRFLAIYLGDHLAGSAAGLALVRRCRRSNAGTPLDAVLGGIESDLEADRSALEELMQRLGVKQSRPKRALGRLAELASRVKSNGRLFRYSPLSRVVELEQLAAGIVTKRSLWRSLRAVADEHAVLDAPRLDELIGRATSQYERVMAEHDEAAKAAFPAPSRS